MKNALGKTVLKLRKEKGYTQQELAEMLFCSRELIVKIESGERSISEDSIVNLSVILEFNFVHYKKTSHKYKKLEHYNIVHVLIDVLREGNYKQLENIIENNTIINELNYGYPYIIKEYCNALILVNIYNNYSRAEKKLLKILNLNTVNSFESFEPCYTDNERYFSCILLLSLILCNKKEENSASQLISNTVVFLERNYFNSVLSRSAVDQYYKHVYIALLNNQADILYNQKKYHEALLLCKKIQDFMISCDSYYSLEFVLKLKIQISYKIGLMDLTQSTYDEFLILCRIKNKEEFFYSTNKIFKEEFPLIEISKLN